MTKEEFIQKAALIILEKHNEEFLGIDVVVGYSKGLADAVYGEEKKSEEDDEKPSSTSYDDELISNVINEIDRIDEEDVKKRRKEAYEKGYRGYRPQKKGYAFRLKSSFEYLEIKTVGDLLRFGRQALYRSRNIGKNCVDIVADALYNLYEIRF